MGLNVGQIIDRTRLELMGGGREEMNTLGQAITTTPTPGTIETYTTTYPLGGITPGAFITIDEEMMYVFLVNQANSSFTAARGENSTTPVAHAINARIHVNDPFPRSMIMNALQDEIRSWGPQVFNWNSVDIPLQTNVVGYDLGAIDPWFDVIDLRVTPDPNFYAVDTKDWYRPRFKAYHDMPSPDFPSGNGVIITAPSGSGGWSWNIANVPQLIHVTYSCPFDVDTNWTEATDLVDDCQLDPSDQDIPALGAMWRLLRGREARRAIINVAGDPAQEAQVPPLYISKTAQQFKIERDSRLADAQTRLAIRFPTRMST